MRFFKVWFALSLVFVLSSPPMAATAAEPQNEKLEMYVLEGSADAIAEATKGLELLDVQVTAAGTRVEVVLTRREAAKIRAQGISVDFVRNAQGQTVTEQAELMAANGFTVWRSWDEAGGIRDELYAIARQNPQIVKLEVLGHTYQGRELIALKVTQGARGRGRRLAPIGPVLLQPARARMDQPRSQSADAALLHRRVAGERPGDQKPAQDHRAVVHPVRKPGRLPVQLRRRTSVAEEPARQQRGRADHRRRRRRSEPQLQRALGLRRRRIVE